MKVYLILTRMKAGDALARTWEPSGCVFLSRSAAENDIEIGRSIFCDYAIAECVVSMPKDES